MTPIPWRRCLFVLAIASANEGECAAARSGALLVKQGNAGVPCFTIAEAEEARGGAPDFRAISVTEVGAKTTMWKMALPAHRTFPVTFRMCIPYAGRLPVLPQTPAAPLRPGTVYEVAIEARAPRSGSGVRDYRARFCLVAQNGGEPEVRNIALISGKQRPSCGSL